MCELYFLNCTCNNFFIFNEFGNLLPMMKKHIPNFITSLNLLCGCIGIYYLVDINFQIAALMIFCAALFDFFDGLSARLLKAGSAFGKSLDSLADLVSFGVLPGILVLKLQLKLTGGGINLWSEYSLFQQIKLLSPLLIPLFSGLRLAKFDNDPEQAQIFRGLPTPANGLFIAALAWSFATEIPGLINILNSDVVFLSTTLTAILLISPFPFFSLKFKSLSLKENFRQYLLLVIISSCLFIWKIPGIMLSVIAYIILSIIPAKKVC